MVLQFQPLQRFLKQRGYRATITKCFNRIGADETISLGFKAIKINGIVITIKEKLERMKEIDSLIENYYLDDDEDESFENKVYQRANIVRFTVTSLQLQKKDSFVRTNNLCFNRLVVRSLLCRIYLFRLFIII